MSADIIPALVTEAPSNASSYEQVCLRPLPPNTSLDARVLVDDSTVDFYYHYEPLPGASASSRKWVCRTVRQATGIQSGEPGEVLYDVQQIDTNAYDAQASAICSQDNPGFFSQLACGTATWSSLPQAAKGAIYAIAGIISLVLLIEILSITRAVT